jgi:IPT/TIG domain-containing protein
MADFLYVYAIKVTNIIPAYGSGGDTDVTIFGQDFDPAATVDFDGTPADSVVVVSSEQITCVAPVHADGLITVTVTNPDTTSASGTFTYQATGPEFFTTLNRVRRENTSIQITDTLGQPKTMTLTSEDEPDEEMDVQVVAFGIELFSGTVQHSVERYEDQIDQIVWDLTCGDRTVKLNFLRPVGTFTDVSASTVITTIMAASAPDFDVSNVDDTLPNISIVFDGTQSMSDALTAIMSAVKGHWFLDGLFLFAFLNTTSVGPAPDDLTDDNADLLHDGAGDPVKIELDYTQIRNAVTVKGAGVSALVEDGDSIDRWKRREFNIIDSTLTTVEACTARGNIDLANFAQPIPTITYSTRDMKTRAGKFITLDLTTMPQANGSYLIQSVAIDQIHDATGLKPRFTVKASPLRFDFLDMMQATVMAGSTVGTPNIPPGSITPDKLSGCIPTDKLQPSGAAPGSYGDATHVAAITVDASGRITAVSETAITGGSGSVESVTDDSGGVVTVDNTDPANPVVGFGGVNVDGTTITGDGTSGSPLTATGGGGGASSPRLVARIIHGV